MFEHIRLRLKLLKDDVVLVVVMLAMAIVLTMIFGQAFNGDYLPSIRIVDLDNTETSMELQEVIISTVEGFEFRSADLKEMQQSVKENSIAAGVVIEEGFESDYSKIKKL